MPKKQINKSYAMRLLRILLSATVLIFFMHLLLQYLNWLVFYQQNGLVYELANRFDLDDESSVPTWFSQILFFLIGVLALLAAYLEAKIAPRRLWQVIGAVGLIFSIDEVAGLHEFVLQSLHVLFFKDATPTSSDNAWLLIAPIILLAASVFAWKMWRLLPRRTLFLFVAAGSIFLVGAIAVDMLTSVVPRESFLNQGMLVAFEETLELLGTVIVVYAIVDFLEIHHRMALGKARKQLSS
ncbi:hypothetical protein KY385_02120 [Candidatus Parcubacteria bacterium]|nr:hypothetical protein [Candidatus Parcubacteria bacterium]